MKNFILISQLGMSIIIPIGLCVLLGSWLDKTYHTELTLWLILLGLLAGIRNAYVLLKQALAEMEGKQDEEG